MIRKIVFSKWKQRRTRKSHLNVRRSAYFLSMISYSLAYDVHICNSIRLIFSSYKSTTITAYSEWAANDQTVRINEQLNKRRLVSKNPNAFVIRILCVCVFFSFSALFVFVRAVELHWQFISLYEYMYRYECTKGHKTYAANAQLRYMHDIKKRKAR